MVVVHVRDDHVADVGMADAGGFEPFLDRMDDLALALLGHRRVEARVDDDRAAAANDRPDEVVERHVGVFVRVAVDEVTPGFPADFGVLDREYFVLRSGHMRHRSCVAWRRRC